MTPAGWLSPFVTVATVACLALIIPAPALGAGQTESAPATPTPAPPTVEGKKSKWGATLSARRKTQRAREKRDDNATGSLEHNPGRPRVGKSVADPHSASQLPFRLNIGVCGRMGPDGSIPGPTRCMPFEGDPPVAPTPGVVAVRVPQPQDVRWEQILSEYKNVLFPKLGVKVQPAGRTLVNLDTIVYTEDSKVSTSTVTLLGFPVVVEATPMSYRWSFGDGDELTTTTPGKPYPAKEITHKYMQRGGVSVSVTTNYAARFNVAGTGWQYIDGTVPISGPATPLLIREAVPVLVEPSR